MDRYGYLFLGLILFVISMVLLVLSKQLRWVALGAGVVGAILGPIGEILFYYKDYWKPPTLSGGLGVSLEHIIFGFSITVISVLIYPVIFRKEIKLKFKESKLGIVIALFIASFFTLTLFSGRFSINSIYVSSVLFLVCGGCLIFMRRELSRVAITSGLMVMIVGFMIYLVLSILYPDYLQKYWLLDSGGLILKTIAGVPTTELLWFFSYGFLASTGYIYIFRGEISSRLHNSKK